MDDTNFITLLLQMASVEAFIGFILGCMATYTFCVNTFMRIAKERITERDEVIAQLQEKVESLERVIYNHFIRDKR